MQEFLAAFINAIKMIIAAIREIVAFARGEETYTFAH